MKYEILEHGMGMKFCVLNAISGVGNNAQERAIFQRIFQSNKIEYYKCPYCYYVVIGPQYDVLFKDLSILKETKYGIFLEMPEGERINVNRQNFFITCTAKECVGAEEWVKEYIPRPPKEEKGKPENDKSEFTLVERSKREYYK